MKGTPAVKKVTFPFIYVDELPKIVWFSLELVISAEFVVEYGKNFWNIIYV